MDVNQVISLLDQEDSDSVRSFSSECLDLQEPLEEQEESEDEDLPNERYLLVSMQLPAKLPFFFLNASYNCVCTTLRYMYLNSVVKGFFCRRFIVRILVLAMAVHSTLLLRSMI